MFEFDFQVGKRGIYMQFLSCQHNTKILTSASGLILCAKLELTV